MHLLLFHEAVQTDPSSAPGPTASAGVHGDSTGGDAAVQGSHHKSARLSMAVEAAGRGPPSPGVAGAGVGGNSRGERRLSAPGTPTTEKSGRFATTGRVQEFRAVLKGAAAHASKMKVRFIILSTRLEQGFSRAAELQRVVLKGSGEHAEQMWRRRGAGFPPGVAGVR